MQQPGNNRGGRRELQLTSMKTQLHGTTASCPSPVAATAKRDLLHRSLKLRQARNRNVLEYIVEVCCACRKPVVRRVGSRAGGRGGEEVRGEGYTWGGKGLTTNACTEASGRREKEGGTQPMNFSLVLYSRAYNGRSSDLINDVMPP